jgi:hypothetical protein
MKKILVMALAAVTFASCQQKGSSEATTADSTNTTMVSSAIATPDAPVMTFETINHDFGKIKEGEKVVYEFKFKNTGKTPLIISNASATCGCTIPEIPKDPVKPGAEGVIKVVFDSTGKSGLQDKVVTITSNANPAINDVHLTGDVNAAS